MSAKKDSAVALVVVSTSIAQPDSIATVAPEVVPSVEYEFCTKHFFVINTNCSDPKALAQVELNGFRFHTSLLHSLPVLFLKFSCIVQI